MIKYCKCGCGQIVKENRRYINFHGNKNNKIWTKQELIIKIQKIFKNKQLKKSDFWENNCLYNLPSINVINKFFVNLDNLAKECNIKFTKRDRRKYLIEHPEVKQKILKNNPVLQKGRIFSKETKQKLSNSCKGRIPHNKNKTNIERYGIEKANQIRENSIKKHTKYSEEYLINKTKEMFNKHGELSRSQFCNLMQKEGVCNIETLRYRFKSMDTLANKANINFKQLEYPYVYINGIVIRLVKGNNEDKILDEIERKNNVNIERSFFVFNNEQFFIIDGVDHKNKIFYEVDEKHHFNKKQVFKDKKREYNILKIYPDYKFLRIKESQHLYT